MKKFSENYIITLEDSKATTDIGLEGFERGKIKSLGLKSPRMLFVLDNAFRDFISYIGYKKELTRGLSYDEVQSLSEKILKKDLPLEMQEEFESDYQTWKMNDKHILLEIRLSNKDNNLNYIENVKPQIVSSFDQLLVEIKKCWVKALDEHTQSVVVQITEIPTYDVSGFAYINKEIGTLEVNCLYGLWVNQEKLSEYDICFVDLETSDLSNYTIGNQKGMVVKEGRKLKEVPVSNEWRRSAKLSKSQLRNLINKSKELSKVLNRSIEFSFGIQKNHIYIHDLKNLTSIELDDEYTFADDFFLDRKNNDFQNEIDAISNMELPFFLREDIKTIEENIDRSSKKNLFVDRLKKDLKKRKRSFKSDYKKIDTINELFSKEDEYNGFLIEFEIFLKTVNSLEKTSPELIHSILINSANSIENYFKSFTGINKEVILKLSKLGNKLEENKNPHYFSNTLDLVPLRKLGLEILIFKKILKEGSVNLPSLSLPSLRSFEEMEYVLSILSLSEIEEISKDSVKLYVDLSIPSMLFEYSREKLPKKYLLDGVIVDLNLFMKTFLNKRVFTERDYQISVEYLKANLKSVKNNISNLTLIVRDIQQSDEIISQLKPDRVVFDEE